MSATNHLLAAAHAEVKAEIVRTDTRTGLLRAFVGAVLAGAWTVAKFTGLRRAVDLTCAGGALLILAALIAAGGAL
ncbi:hypothetical protein [Streptomyces parvulus]|uniref:Uncharacterized protein n=1 Tax=Streptomyces parvulus TaxID=146923 RepID=A0A369V8G8_9ACTN|nr:hypothetical protein [Streptomyces parvulus]RDD88505.1 hypothetical protein DVZ84_14285 [Streptomyces parvulus]